MPTRTRIRRLAVLGTRFLTVGAISTVIEITVFNVLHYALGWDVVTSKIVASLVALVNAYFGNREWTFKHRGQHGRVLELVLFLLVNAVCTALGAGIVAAGVSLFDSPGPVLVNAVNLVSIVIVVVVRFVFYHYIVFRGVRPTVASAESERTVG
ncbi:putative flippase GtrA [Mycetocola sp. CAN_C7]|uniref:GtrA family protein n=1 Tax=Mycetocola sp. CAN_C7 TaxID=2787724 RepID=UPI0018CB084A